MSGTPIVHKGGAKPQKEISKEEKRASFNILIFKIFFLFKLNVHTVVCQVGKIGIVRASI